MHPPLSCLFMNLPLPHHLAEPRAELKACNIWLKKMTTRKNFANCGPPLVKCKHQIASTLVQSSSFRTTVYGIGDLHIWQTSFPYNLPHKTPVSISLVVGLSGKTCNRRCYYTPLKATLLLSNKGKGKIANTRKCTRKCKMQPTWHCLIKGPSVMPFPAIM